MGVLFCRRISSIVLLLAAFPLLCAAADQRNGRKYTPPPATATIKVTVVGLPTAKLSPTPLLSSIPWKAIRKGRAGAEEQ